MKIEDIMELDGRLCEIIEIDNNDTISMYSGSGMKTIAVIMLDTGKKIYCRDFNLTSIDKNDNRLKKTIDLVTLLKRYKDSFKEIANKFYKDSDRWRECQGFINTYAGVGGGVVIKIIDLYEKENNIQL